MEIIMDFIVFPLFTYPVGLYIGSVFKGGTGYCELILDTKKIQNSEYIEKETRNTKNNISINTIANAIMEDQGDEGEAIYIPE